MGMGIGALTGLGGYVGLGGKAVVPAGTRTSGSEVVLARDGESHLSSDLTRRPRRILLVRGKLYKRPVAAMVWTSGGTM